MPKLGASNEYHNIFVKNQKHIGTFQLKKCFIWSCENRADIPCKRSPKTICMKCKTLFPWKYYIVYENVIFYLNFAYYRLVFEVKP